MLECEGPQLASQVLQCIILLQAGGGCSADSLGTSRRRLSAAEAHTYLRSSPAAIASAAV